MSVRLGNRFFSRKGKKIYKYVEKRENEIYSPDNLFQSSSNRVNYRKALKSLYVTPPPLDDFYLDDDYSDGKLIWDQVKRWPLHSVVQFKQIEEAKKFDWIDVDDNIVFNNRTTMQYRMYPNRNTVEEDIPITAGHPGRPLLVDGVDWPIWLLANMDHDRIIPKGMIDFSKIPLLSEGEKLSTGFGAGILASSVFPSPEPWNRVTEQWKDQQFEPMLQYLYNQALREKDVIRLARKYTLQFQTQMPNLLDSLDRLQEKVLKNPTHNVDPADPDRERKLDQKIKWAYFIKRSIPVAKDAILRTNMEDIIDFTWSEGSSLLFRDMPLDLPFYSPYYPIFPLSDPNPKPLDPLPLYLSKV